MRLNWSLRRCSWRATTCAWWGENIRGGDRHCRQHTSWPCTSSSWRLEPSHSPLELTSGPSSGEGKSGSFVDLQHAAIDIIWPAIMSAPVLHLFFNSLLPAVVNKSNKLQSWSVLWPFINTSTTNIRLKDYLWSYFQRCCLQLAYFVL